MSLLNFNCLMIRGPINTKGTLATTTNVFWTVKEVKIQRDECPYKECGGHLRNPLFFFSD